MERLLYQDAARKFAKQWRRDVNEHVIDIMVSVMMARDGIRPGGGFVNAVLNNDLYSAITIGDDDVLKELKLITLTKSQAYVDTLININDYENPE